MVLRHKEVELCAQGAWAQAMFLNFHARNHDPPDFTSKKKWYPVPFSASKADRTKHVAYQVRSVNPRTCAVQRAPRSPLLSLCIVSANSSLTGGRLPRVCTDPS